MTVRRGAGWGDRATRTGGPAAASDAELAAVVARAREAGSAPAPTLLTGGDLFRTLGGVAGADHGDAAIDVLRCSVDVLAVEWDGGTALAAAHVVAGDPSMRRHVAVAMNAAFIDDRNLGPRAHPGDGLVDVTEGRLGWRDARRAGRRSRVGAHLPHPGLRTLRVADWATELPGPLPLAIDGVVVGRTVRLRVTVIPDAVAVDLPVELPRA